MQKISNMGNSFLPIRFLFVDKRPGYFFDVLQIADYCATHISPLLKDKVPVTFPFFRLFCIGDLHIDVGRIKFASDLALEFDKLPKKSLPNIVAFLGDIFHKGGLEEKKWLPR